MLKGDSMYLTHVVTFAMLLKSYQLAILPSCCEYYRLALWPFSGRGSGEDSTIHNHLVLSDRARKKRLEEFLAGSFFISDLLPTVRLIGT